LTNKGRRGNATFYSYVTARSIKVDFGCGLQLVLSLTRVM